MLLCTYSHENRANAPAQGKLLQMEAIEATVCRKGSIRQDSAYSGSIIAYGGFAWLPRQRKQIRQVTWQPRTWRLERGGLNQATKNMEAGTWMPVPGSRNLEPVSGYLPSNSSQTIPSHQIKSGRQPRHLFRAKPGLCTCCRKRAKPVPAPRGFRKQVYRTLGCELHGVPSGVVQRPKV